MRACRSGFLLLSAALVAGCATTSAQLPSPWAVTYPDTSHIGSGRVVRFAGHYGLLGPSPALVFRDQGGTVRGEVLVWYRRFEPGDAGRRSAADSLAEWGRMQEAMRIDRARFDSTFGCTSWARGVQEGPAWVCRVPERHGTVDWTARLQRLDSLIQARRNAAPTIGLPPPPELIPPTGVTRFPVGGAAGCMDGGSWIIALRDSAGTRSITAPPPTACPRPDGPGKRYEQAGWDMLKEFIAAVRAPA